MNFNETNSIYRVEYKKFLHLPWIQLDHNIDVCKPYSYEGYAPTGEMWSLMCGFGNHAIVMYNKGMGNKEVIKVE